MNVLCTDKRRGQISVGSGGPVAQDIVFVAFFVVHHVSFLFVVQMSMTGVDVGRGSSGGLLTTAQFKNRHRRAAPHNANQCCPVDVCFVLNFFGQYSVQDVQFGVGQRAVNDEDHC